MASLEHIVSRNLQCPVCLNLLSDPKQLLCSHTFCKKCLRDILACSRHKSANSLACPICRDDTTVKGGDVENLKTNFPLKALVDDLRNSKQLCEICDSNSRATRFCCECGKNMCSKCLEIHNKWPPHLKHRLVSVEDIREGRVVLEKKTFCPEHPSENTKRVCTDVCITCKKFVCERCRLTDHKDHIVQSAEEYNTSTKKQIESLQARGKTKASTIVNHQTCIESQQKRVNDHNECRKAEISKLYQDLTERKAALDKQLETQRMKLCQRLDEMKDADERFVTSIESASVLAGNSLKAPLDDNNIVIRDSLSAELKNVLGRDDPKKKLATDVGDRAEQLIFTSNIERDQLNIGEVQFVKCELECDVALSKKDNMNGMAPTPDGRIAVGYSSGGIDIFSADGQLQQTVLNDAKIYSMGFLSDGRYVVRNTSNTVYLYTHKCEKLDVSFETLGEDGGGSDLAVDSNDLIFVGYIGAKKIQVFSPAGGKAIREIPCDHNKYLHITCYKDLLIITSWESVRVMEKKGNDQHCVYKPWARAHAAVTKNDSILIAWVKHNDGLISIDEYTNELKHVKNIISDQKIGKPLRHWYYLQEFQSGEIAFCTPDRLYIFKLTITPTNV